MKLFGKKTTSTETKDTSKQRTILVFGSPKSGTSSLTYQFIKNRVSVTVEEKQHKFTGTQEVVISPRNPEKHNQTLETFEKLNQEHLQQLEDRTAESLNEQYEEMKSILKKTKEV